MVIRKGGLFIFRGEGELAESFKWLFIDFIPLLYEKNRVARQFQVEMWLNPSPIIESLKLKNINVNKQTSHPTRGYVI